MDEGAVLRLLERVARGDVCPDDAAEELARLSTADLGFARVDRQRALRRGRAEVVLGQGKTDEQLVEIVAAISASRQTALVTRVGAAVGETLAARFAGGVHEPVSRTFVLHPGGQTPPAIPGLLVVSAGTADLPVAEEAAVAAEAFGLAVDRLYDVGVAGLHRLVEHMDRLRRARAVVVVAGMEGALPSVVTGLVRAPVIGVPTSVGYGASLGGWAALLGMLCTCASGLTVVNIDNGFGAACAAHAILTGARVEAPAGGPR